MKCEIEYLFNIVYPDPQNPFNPFQNLSPGDLPRNAGRGPGLFTLDLNLTREFRLAGRARLRPAVEIANLLNATVFTFGAEFVDFRAQRADTTPAERRAALDSFLAPTRTLRPRGVRVGVRLDF